MTISVSGQTAKTYRRPLHLEIGERHLLDPMFRCDHVNRSALRTPHDGKAYALSGTIVTGAYVGGSISTLVYFPPSPCLIDSFTGGLTLYPPNPA